MAEWNFLSVIKEIVDDRDGLLNHQSRVRWFWLAAFILVVFLSCREAFELFLFYLKNARLPLWDMTSYCHLGFDLHRDLKSGNLLAFSQHIHGHHDWPFGFSLLLVPFFHLGEWLGLSPFASATLVSSISFASIPPLLLWVTGEENDGWPGLAAGLLASGLFLQSPFYRLYGILIMREVPGVAFLLLALGLQLRARRLKDLAAYRLAGLATLALFFIKFTYGVLWLATLVADGCVSLARSWRPLTNKSRRLILLKERLKNMNTTDRAGLMNLGILLVMLTAIRVGIGISLELVFLSGTVWLMWIFYRNQGFRDRWMKLPPRSKAFIETVFLPIWIWFLGEDHLRCFLKYLSPDKPGFFPERGLSSYGEAWLHNFNPDPWWGILVGLAVVVSLLKPFLSRRLPNLLELTAFVGILSAVLFPFREDRFVATVVPPVFLLGSLTLGEGLLGRSARWWNILFLGIIMALYLGIVSREDQGRNLRLKSDYCLNSLDPSLEPCLDFIVDALPGSTRLAIAGIQVSPPLIEWRLDVRPDRGQVEIIYQPDPYYFKVNPLDMRGEAKKWIDKNNPLHLVAIRASSVNSPYRSGNFYLWNQWQEAVIDYVVHSPGWTVASRKTFLETGLEIFIVRRLD